ncbi:rho GTPase-activating protein gacU-like isoform X2 [Saccostrea cucullata]|uniref:rho GTPase-activating protein gacU-like isoform X2 n=1 Tax=Saccostrea cuccullata TaxID=36930 RepID=UPI002ED11AC5
MLFTFRTCTSVLSKRLSMSNIDDKHFSDEDHNFLLSLSRKGILKRASTVKMARTKASVLDQDDSAGGKSSGKSKTNQQKRRKDKAQSNDSVKKKKIKKSESEDSDEQSKLPQFYKGTTWPLDAKVEVHVDYEEVKEVRKIKPPFLPLLYQLTRGEPENIAKAVNAIPPVHQLLKERFEKENKPEVKQEAVQDKHDKKPLVVNPKKVDMATLKKIPSQHFRDAKGKWLPKKRWKFAEILKNKPKLQHLLSERTANSDGNRAANKGHQGTAKKLTLLAEARSAIEEVLARVCMRRQEFAKLIVWLRSLEMKSYGKSNTLKSVTPWRKKNRSSPRSKPKDVPKAAVEVVPSVEVQEADSSSDDDDDANVPVKKAMYGLEKSAIIRNARLRNKPKYMPYIPPKIKEPAKVTSKTIQENVVSAQHSGSTKSLPQQSDSSKSLTPQTGSTKGYSVLFKGRMFSSGKKIFLNRRQNVESESDSEDDEEENIRSSTSSKKSQESRQSKSGLESTDNPNPGKEKSKAQQKIKKSTPSTSKLQESSSSSESEESAAIENIRTLKSSSALFPQVRIPFIKLTDAVKLTNSEKRTCSSASSTENVSKLKRTIYKEGRELNDKPVRKKAKIQMVTWKDDAEKLKDNENNNGGPEEKGEMAGRQSEAGVRERSTSKSPLSAGEDVSREEFSPPEVRIENLEGEDLRTSGEDNNTEDLEAFGDENRGSSSISPILDRRTNAEDNNTDCLGTFGGEDRGPCASSLSPIKDTSRNTEDNITEDLEDFGDENQGASSLFKITDVRTDAENIDTEDLGAHEGEEGADVSSDSPVIESTVTQSSSEERENDSSITERGDNSSNIERGNSSINFESENNCSSTTERGNTFSSSFVDIGNNSSNTERGTNSSTTEKGDSSSSLEKGNNSSITQRGNSSTNREMGDNSTNIERGNNIERGKNSTSLESVNDSSIPERGNSSSNIEIGDKSSNAERPSTSSNNPQTPNTEETLRLLISHLSNLRDSQGKAVDCKILFSSANQVLTISGSKNISLEESIDKKPIIVEGETSGNSVASTSDRVNRVSPDTSNQMDNPQSSEVNVPGIVEIVESDDSNLEFVSSETMATVKQERAEPEGEEAELRNQKEAEAVIIIDD